MINITRKTRTINGLCGSDLPLEELLEANEPVILKGLVKSWPLVQLGQKSLHDTVDYLKSFYNGKPMVTYCGSPEIKGKFFYNNDFTALNFSAKRKQIGEFLEDTIGSIEEDYPCSFYIGSSSIDSYLPGLRDDGDLVMDNENLSLRHPLASIWIGNRTVAAAHFDVSHNIACCVVGKRRFTLFPPDQVQNLYPGPLEPTPGGQVVSLVDFEDPDWERFPKFSEAIGAGQVADLEPGDALFYPSLWWHQVEALESLNVLVNYWWNECPAYMDTPMNTLLHAILSLRGRSDQEKKAWKSLFDYYIFGHADKAVEQIPEHARGNLGPLNETSARRLRALLLQRLNR